MALTAGSLRVSTNLDFPVWLKPLDREPDASTTNFFCFNFADNCRAFSTCTPNASSVRSKFSVDFGVHTQDFCKLSIARISSVSDQVYSSTLLRKVRKSGMYAIILLSQRTSVTDMSFGYP